MKTTLDLPDALVKEVKVRAVQEGRKLKDAVAELLRRGLAASAVPESPPPEPVVGKDRRTGLPLIGCRHQPAQGESSPRRMAAMLLEQETGWIHDAGG
jgi:hypothetical protein